MKIVKIENNSGKWFDLNTEVGVKTNEGVKKVINYILMGLSQSTKLNLVME